MNSLKPIDPNEVREYVFNSLGCNLEASDWSAIDRAFEDVWNNQLGYGAWFYYDDLAHRVDHNLRRQMVYVPHDVLQKIVALIIESIEVQGGLLE